MAKPGRKPRIASELALAEQQIDGDDAKLAKVLDRVMGKIATRLDTEVHEAKLRDLPLMLAIITDKRAILKGNALGNSKQGQTFIQINGADVSPDGLREMLAGRVRPARVIETVSQVGSLPPKRGHQKAAPAREPAHEVPASASAEVPPDSNSVLTSVPLSSAAAQQVTVLPASGASCFATAGSPPPAPQQAGGAGVQAGVPAPDRVVHSP